MAAITRRDLARALKDQHGGSITEHDQWIQAFVEILSQKISEAGRVEIRGFGAFSLGTIKEHTTVDPSSRPAKGKKRKTIKVPKSYTVDFRPSKLYRQRLKADQTSRDRQPSAEKKGKDE